jgi:hypothetical protein
VIDDPKGIRLSFISLKQGAERKAQGERKRGQEEERSVRRAKSEER